MGTLKVLFLVAVSNLLLENWGPPSLEGGTLNLEAENDFDSVTYVFENQNPSRKKSAGEDS
jgi:hypothetical protein